ncbi:MAG TPA: NifU N-terminal domain-containing protein [Longimicrobiales bacterium]|nr:NifU N-terminal domain-containing protein [Longimicrobiales bacterium]
MPKLKVDFQQTPNPNAGKFVVSQQVAPVGTSRSYYDRKEAREDPVARALMALEGVRSVFMVDDFVTVTKIPAARWEALVPKVEEAIREHL